MAKSESGSDQIIRIHNPFPPGQQGRMQGLIPVPWGTPLCPSRGSRGSLWPTRGSRGPLWRPGVLGFTKKMSWPWNLELIRPPNNIGKQSEPIKFKFYIETYCIKWVKTSWTYSSTALLNVLASIGMQKYRYCRNYDTYIILYGNSENRCAAHVRSNLCDLIC